MNYKKSIFKGLLAIALLGSLSACEKPILDEEEEESTTTTKEQGSNKQDSKGNVVIRVTNFNLTPITKAVVDLTTYCTRLNYVLYKDGNKVVGKSQLKEDADFGEMTMTVDPGTYKLLVLAHSSTNGNPTLSDPENIQFTNKLGYSDTFYYYGDLEVTSEPKTHELTLTRASTLLKFIITDEIPENVTNIYIHYTGGSGVLNAVTGYGGNVDSRQEKNAKIQGYSSPLSIRIYTFLQSDEGYLNLKVEARDANNNNNVVLSREFEHINVKRNCVTEYEGSFFSHENSLTLLADTAWNDTLHYNY